MFKRPNRVDLIVVGAGTAGLATAIRARLSGMTVAVIDSRFTDAETGIDKPCGEGLMPPAVDRLAELGVTLRGGWPLYGVRYVFPKGSYTGDFRSGNGLGVRRTVLSAALLQRADQLGVQLVAERAESYTDHGSHVAVGEWQADWLVAADGLNSKLRAQAGLTDLIRGPRRYGVRAFATIKPWSDHVEVHWGRVGELYVTPVAPNLVNIAMLAPVGTALSELTAAYRPILERCGPLSPWQGAAMFPQRSVRRQAGRLFLIGDAAGFVDPITGEGNDLALNAANALVDSLVEDRPEAYDARWLAVTRRYRLVTNALLMLTRHGRGLMPVVLGAAPWLLGAGVNYLSGTETHSVGTLQASPRQA